MNALRKRKFNTLYLTLKNIAICMVIMTSIELSSIFGVLIGILTIIFVKFDKRSEYAFPDGDEDIEGE